LRAVDRDGEGAAEAGFWSDVSAADRTAFQKLKQLIDGGELGQIVRVNWIITDWFRTEAYYASGGWRATWKGEGGGALLKPCPHQLDLLAMACWMPG
jgi:predicted dehydrogenase